jgi:hypothetical protein
MGLNGSSLELIMDPRVQGISDAREDAEINKWIMDTLYYFRSAEDKTWPGKVRRRKIVVRM